MTDVFVSRPTWVAPAFLGGLDGFLRILGTLGLRPRTVGTTDYPTNAPLDEVIRILSECSGAVILGYPQISITTGTLKDTPISPPLELPTEWNHIEAGLAYACNLPLLVIHHSGVRRGIFDRGAIARFIYEIDLADSSWPLRQEIQGALSTWNTNVVAPRSPSIGTTTAAPALRPAISEDQVRVLHLLAEAGDRMTAEEIAPALGMSVQRGQLYLDKLLAADLVGRSRIVDQPSAYGLAPGGRRLLAERGLI